MQDNKNKVLKLSTSGSVDDGKSTLIGRLLYDTNSLKKDKLDAIKRSSEKQGYDYLDFSLATDGLVAEREQGITIDVAHIFFSTPHRSYIIADTPGHVEYTRNMITGTSTSQVSLILVDARNGVTEQTRRHFFITNLIRIKEVIVAVNKMDLVGYSEDMYNDAVAGFRELIEASDFKEQHVTFIPISALYGKNIVTKSDKLSWYSGPSLMEYLESIKLEDTQENAKARFQVQAVIRPNQTDFPDYRGYAGKLRGGDLSVGDTITILPSQRQSSIKTIEYFDQQYDAASNGSSITITLVDDVDVSRGDMIVKSGEEPESTKLISAKICWMDDRALREGDTFFLQKGARSVKAKIKSVIYRFSTDKPDTREKIEQLNMNDLGLVEIQMAQAMFFDGYKENQGNGTFILIDPQSNNTSGVGFVE